MGEFNREKYRFSLKPSISVVSDEITAERKSEIDLIESELLEYNILIKDLVAESPSLNERNTILNLAHYIIEQTDIYEYLIEGKKLPTNKLARMVPLTKSFFEKWKEYIITYVIILANPNYTNIQQYLKIEEAIHILGTDDEIEQHLNKKYTGVVFLKNIFRSIILTKTGQFKKVRGKQHHKVGEELTSKGRKNIKDYKKQVSVLSALTIVAVSLITYKYFSVDKTIIIETVPNIKIDSNCFDRVVETYSPILNVNKELEGLRIKDRNIDIALKKALEYAKNKEIIKQNDLTITVTGIPLKYDSLQQTEKFILDNDINLKLNNSGDEHRINKEN